MSNLGEWEVTEAMIRFGGGFVSKLGALYRQADDDNKAKLRAAFPEYFEDYTKIAAAKVDSLR